jgi:kynureninase
MRTKPVYLGIEAVSIPAFHIHITPGYVREMVSITRQAGARGVVLSWDLLHMPYENLAAAGEIKSL